MTNYLINTAKEKTERFFRPLMRVLKKTKASPNFLTLCAFLSGAISVVFLRTKYFGFFAALSVLFDIFDGHLARYANRVTELGKWLDYSSDRSVELLLILFSHVPRLVEITALLFLVHQFLFIFKERTIFPARTFLMVFFFFGYLKEGLYFAIVCYSLGIIWQLTKKKLFKNAKSFF